MIEIRSGLCRSCRYWKQQNSKMGHCMYPLPALAREAIGDAAMKKGIYAWIDYVMQCEAHEPRVVQPVSENEVQK